jgi:hypothetical protein
MFAGTSALATERHQAEHARLAAEAKEEAARTDLAFLLKASTALTSDLDYTQTLRRLAASCVPALAPLCTVGIADATSPQACRRPAALHRRHHRSPQPRPPATGRGTPRTRPEPGTRRNIYRTAGHRRRHLRRERLRRWHRSRRQSGRPRPDRRTGEGRVVESSELAGLIQFRDGLVCCRGHPELGAVRRTRYRFSRRTDPAVWASTGRPRSS